MASRRKKPTADQRELAFGCGESDADDRATRKPHKKKKPAVAAPGVWENCAAGYHRLCAVEVMPNDLPIRLIRCACKCHAKEVQ